MRALIFGWAAIAVTALSPAMAHAATYAADHCQVTVPSDWVASKSRTASPDKKRWATLLSAPTAAEIVQMETGLGAKTLSDTPGMVLMSTKASFGGQTNVSYLAVSKSAPSCLAQVVSPAGADEAASKQIALTVKRAN